MGIDLLPTSLAEVMVQTNTKAKTLSQGQRVVVFTGAGTKNKDPRQAGLKLINPSKDSAGKSGMEQ